MTISKHIIAALVLLLATAAPIQAKNYKIATVSPDGLSWMQKLRAAGKEIDKKTEGRVKLKIYPGGVQGDDFTVLRKIKIGQLHGGAVAAGSLTRFYPDLQVYSLPLVFQSYEEVDYVRSRMDQRIEQGLTDGGMEAFSLTETGFAYLLTKQPVANVADLKSLKAWVPEGDPVSEAVVQTFDINPIPLNITDVLTSLQTGIIDTVAVPPLVAIALQWHNHVDYVMDLPLVYVFSLLAIDSKQFNKMTPADQKLVKTTLNAMFKQVDRDNRVDNVRAFAALQEQGIEVIKPSAEDLAGWQQIAEASTQRLLDSGDISADVVNQIQRLLNEYRQQQQASR